MLGEVYQPPLFLYNIIMILQIKNIIKKYLATIEDDDTSVLIFGSALNSDWTDVSDIDIFLISDNQKTSVSHKYIDGITLEIQKDNFSQLMQDLESERGNLKNRNLATMIATAKVLKSSNNEQMQTLQQKAEEILDSPTKYSKEDETAWRESIEDYLSKCEKDLKRNDAVAFQLDSTYVMQNLLDLFFAKHNSYLPQPKQLKKHLKDLDSDFAKLFEEFSRANTLLDRLKFLSELYTEILQ